MNSDKATVNESTIQRVKRLRGELVKEHPFYGHLAMHLILAAADIGTAGTDGKHLIVDPHFAEQLSDEELSMIIMHEVLHCALSHMARRKNKNPVWWNIACDIVINSMILLQKKEDDYCIGDTNMMHRMPDGSEGYQYTAEEAYNILSSCYRKKKVENENYILDNHEYWDDAASELIQDKWKEVVSIAVGRSAGKIPDQIKELRPFRRRTRAIVNWKQALRDFIYTSTDEEEDYSFRPPERRYRGSIIYPGLNPSDTEVISNLLVFADKSASISAAMEQTIMDEIAGMLEMITEIRGRLYFFDWELSEEMSFTGKKDIRKLVIPVTCGGTSFQPIFQHTAQLKKREEVAGVIVLTDGYALIPETNPLINVPVLWIIIDSDVRPPWGRVIGIDSRDT